MRFKTTILGCGSSGGVPRIGGFWGVCDPTNPKNRRGRCALLVEQAGAKGATAILVDSPPDLREQLLEADVGAVDAVLYTHDHADHTNGIDDLRMIAFNRGRKVPVFHDAATGKSLKQRFGYCFETPEGSEYPPVLVSNEIGPSERLTVEGAGGAIEVLPFLQQHGSITNLGYRFGGLAYSPDVSDLPEPTLAQLQDLDVWIVDALRPSPHPSHFSLEQALAWIERVRPRLAVLTHMHIDLDYDMLMRELPEGVVPAYDGMVIEHD
jgi:phosphoribosyl 1,2-cyclic phosphate phosphodiesterase